MRWSRFVNFYKEQNSVILFNSVTRGVDLLEKEHLKTIDDYLNGKFHETVSDEMKEAISELYIDEYIVPDTYCEKEVFIKLRHERDKESKIVMYFVPTFNCNFRCPYCIVSATDHDCLNLQNVITDKDTVDAAQWLVDYARKNDIKHVTVELFGGEPMLGHKQNLIFFQTLSTLKDEGVKLEFNMISNCYNLTEANLNDLKEAGIQSIQCTIDGPREIHNKRRILSNGNGSFDVILRNIKKCRDFRIRITIRINIDEENAPYITELIQYLAENHFNEFVSIGIAPVDPPLDDFSLTGHTEKVMQYVPEIFNSLKEHNFDFKMWETFCGNGTKNFFVLCPDGNLYNCPSYAGMEGYSVGNIHEGGFRTDRPGMHEIPEKCYSCSLVGVCSGGCYFMKNVHNLGEEFCMKSTHLPMVNSFISAKYGNYKK